MDVLLVHGGSHDATCWKPLVHALTALGISTATVDLPSAAGPGHPPAGVAEDARAIRARLVEHHPRMVLCHSYGGIPTTDAVLPSDGVELLIYLAAFMPAEGESVWTVPQADRGEPTSESRVSEDGLYLEATDPISMFYGTTPRRLAEQMVQTLRPQSMRSFSEPVGRAAWRDIPSAYLLTLQDKAIAPAQQRLMAARATSVQEIDSDHSPHLGMPGDVALRVRDLLSSLR
ncbi:alpha/beta fold hydrolase [Kineosporia babensis]|uniref:Alpha/beta fold hydrolase n=1 Tax=Kineosporia babensis TaxID=499548 RepID=A0A9X1NC35_9ACTN|nr:alpha/beta fold hydrolase [Kineosporia babensis]